MKIFFGIGILFWLFAALYFGGGGVTSLELAQEKENLGKMVVDIKDTTEVIFDNKPFINISAARIYQEEKAYEEKYKLAVCIFPWLNLPYSFLGLLITAFAFGTLGGTIRLLKEVANDNKEIQEVKVFSKPLLGAGCGIIILCISYILPLLIVSGETEIRSISIVLVSLFGGLFSERFFEWLSTIFGNIFKN